MKCKMVYQHDEHDCGAAAFSMILSYYELYYPLAYCRELTGTDRSGTSAFGIINGAQTVGLVSDCLQGSFEELLDSIAKGEIEFPLIAHTTRDDGEQHFIVVERLTSRYVYVKDPGKGPQRLSIKTFKMMWTGTIITFSLTDNFCPGKYTQGTMTKFLTLLKGHQKSLILVFILSIVIASSGIATALLFKYAIEQAQNTYSETSSIHLYEEMSPEEKAQHDLEHEIDEHEHEHANESKIMIVIDTFLESFEEKQFNLSIVFKAIIFLYIASSIIQLVRLWLINLVSKEIDLDLSMRFYSQLIHLPMNTVLKRKTGEYLSRFNDLVLIRDALSSIIVTFFFDVVMTISGGIILFSINSTLFYICLAMLLCYAAIILLYKKPLSNINRLSMEAEATTDAFLKESIDGIETLKLNNAESYAIERTKGNFTKLLSFGIKQNLYSGSQEIITNSIELIGIIFVIWIGIQFVIYNYLTIGELVGFYMLMTYFIAPFKDIIQLQPTIQAALIAADRLNDVLELEIERSAKDEVAFPSNWKKIRYENVSFRYGNELPFLTSVDLEINRGEKVAIVGASGSGKTTLAQLLVSCYSPETGNIFIDDCPLNTISLNSIRQHISYARQESFVFSDSIKNNLAIGNKSDNIDRKTDDILDVENLLSFVSDMPEGYNTVLTEAGSNISGGQKQRITLARAQLRHPDILILDEATSNLDYRTENEINASLLKDDQLTLIVIAHRLNSIKNCDRIIVIENGKIVGNGTHDTLLISNSAYQRLWGQV